MRDHPRSGAAAVLVALLVAAATEAYSQVSAPTNSAPNPYHAVENWAKMPEGRTWGSTSGVAIDPDGTSVWVAERCGAFAPPSLMKPGTPFACDGSNLPPILKFDSSGKLVKAFGAGLLLFPHGLHVDRDGNVWVTDGLGKDGKGHQVFKFSPDGKVLMTLGKAGVAGNGPDEFNAPSAVVVAPNGDIFVADGHGGQHQCPDREIQQGRQVHQDLGQERVGPRRNRTVRTRSRWIRAAGSSSAIARTTASKFSIRTDIISISGSSSAARAVSSSTRAT